MKNILTFLLLFSPFTYGLFSQNDTTIKPADDTLTFTLKEKTGDDWFDDPSGNRIILAPTGRTIKQGQVQVASMFIIPWAAFPTVHVGVTDFINFGFGVSVPPGLFYLAPKIRLLKADYFQLSTGMLWIPGQKNSDFSTFAIAYMAATMGSESGAFHAGVGYNFTEDLFEKSPIIMAGGEVRLGTGFKLISENWMIIGHTVPVLTLGFRAFNEFINFDALAVFTPSKEFSIPFYPMVSMGFNFDLVQKKKTPKGFR